MKPRVRVSPRPEDVERVARIERVLRRYGLLTVCELDRCPNLFRCWSHGNVTIAILGSKCTRACPFCAIGKGRVGDPPDPSEPERVARAVRELGLSHIVISSVTRDDLPDFGSNQYALTIRRIKELAPGVVVEVLVPDFMGDEEAVRRVVEAGPDVFGHNIETVRRLHPRIKPGGSYERSLRVLRAAKEFGANLTKSSIILGFGERLSEVVDTMKDLREAEVDILVIGGYANPYKSALMPINVGKEVFEELAEVGRELGFRAVLSSPLARSSFLSLFLLDDHY